MNTSLRSLRCLVGRTGTGTTASAGTLKVQPSRLWMRPMSTTTTHHRPLSTQPQLSEEWPKDNDNDNIADDMLSFRSYAMKSAQFKFPKKPNKKPLDAFMDDLPTTLHLRQEQLQKDPTAFDGEGQEQEDPILSLFRKMNLTRKDWAPYAHFDPTKAYTRNLIYTDNENYTLLLLCWNAGVESKIHDHPCDGCWMQVLQGEVQECRYEYPSSLLLDDDSDNNDGEQTPQEQHEDDGYLKCIADETFEEGQVAFINDNIGLHKVGNPGSIPAVTLHLYHPPFSRCKVWDDSGTSFVGAATHFSEYGWVDGCYLP